MKVNIYMNGYYITTTKVNNETIKTLQDNGFVLESVKEVK